MEFGLHKDGSQDAKVASDGDYIGKEENDKKDGLQSYVFCEAKKDELSDSCPVPPGTWPHRLLLSSVVGDLNLPKGERDTW